ncbi:myelin protein zero-like 1 like isoform X2 [Denticeps clupeoides]|uniref:myelin protein zero-like protein 1 isoform X2 n=1 Tax=Denticeps clupeoides TaxID=299321 RepID=UPI0010A449AC|nr:myelin protein zero-like protein 1 isoform X2 [Denticeps clupeoides]XP_028839610.1 myelin protein zero-like protein 1 isoform X2 [Denticeps clupeoides]
MGFGYLNPAHKNILLCGLFLRLIFGTLPVSAIDVYAPDELLVENGTTGILKCSFKSKEVVSSGATVSWSFVPEGSSESGTTFFHYAGGKPYPGDVPQFKERVLWVGDLNKKDASIQVNTMQFTDNGTYSCDVKNPPDIAGTASRTKVWVVMKESLPPNNAGIIAGAVIGSMICLFLIAIVSYLIIRRQQPRHDYEGDR